MARYISVSQGGKAIHLKTGCTLTVDSGATFTVAGTFSYAIADVDLEGALDVDGQFSVADTKFIVDPANGNTTIAGTLTIGAGLGTITDASNVLTLTETNISLVGIVGITGATTVTGAFGVTGQTTLTGGATDPALVLSGAGNLGSEGRSAIGTHVADGGTFAFTADQQSVRIKIGSTVYQIPIWADA